MNAVKTIAVVVALLGVSSATMAFEEQKAKGAPGAPAAAADPSGKGINLTTPDLMGRKDSGTKIRVPGLGVIGEIPKMDFGLELLYGANQSKENLGIERDAEANGVMGRVRVPLKSP